MLAVVIRKGRIARETIAGTLQSLQDIVGGDVEPFFTEASPYGNGALTGYVNEEGLVIGLPLAFGVVHSPNYIVPLAGDAVIVGLTDEGDTRALTEAEADRVMQCYRTPRGGLCPVIEGHVPDDGKVMMVPVRGVLHLPAMIA